MNSEQEILQRRMAQFLVGEVFNTISEDDVLRKNKEGRWTHKGLELTEGQIKILKQEAVAFSKTHLYSVLAAELRWFARERFNDAMTENNIITSKLLSYFVDVLVSKVKKIAEL